MRALLSCLLVILSSCCAMAQNTDTVSSNTLSLSASESKGWVDISWPVLQAASAHYFDIQRSNNGNDFTAIGFRKASDRSTESSFAFNDRQPVEGKNFYRVISVDSAGNRHCSNTVVIDTRPSGKTDFILTPNPSHTQSTISITGALEGKTVIVLYDSNGSKVSELYSGELSGKAFSTTFSVAEFKKGVYIVSVHIGNQYTRKQLVVE